MTIAARGIPTTYRSTRFRSRLEARWATFFDLIRWPWVYEPFDTDDWIPDFLVRGAFPFLVEVGPCATAAEYVDKGEKARSAYPTARRVLASDDDVAVLHVAERWTLIVGITPVYEEAGWASTAAGFWAIDGAGDSDAAATWYYCDECGILGLESPDHGGYLRPCGHVVPTRPATGSPLFDLWADAGNRVQWRSR